MISSYIIILDEYLKNSGMIPYNIFVFCILYFVYCGLVAKFYPKKAHRSELDNTEKFYITDPQKLLRLQLCQFFPM